MIFDPNIRQKALNVVSNLDTDTLVDMLAGVKGPRHPEVDDLFEAIAMNEAEDQDQEHGLPMHSDDRPTDVGTGQGEPRGAMSPGPRAAMPTPNGKATRGNMGEQERKPGKAPDLSLRKPRLFDVMRKDEDEGPGNTSPGANAGQFQIGQGGNGL